MSTLIAKQGIIFNAASDVARAHHHPDLDQVLHVFDVHWHGIRSATACLPGHKLGISHKYTPSADALNFLSSYLDQHQIRQICYQGFSEMRCISPSTSMDNGAVRYRNMPSLMSVQHNFSIILKWS